jgi:hypothetical protein
MASDINTILKRYLSSLGKNEEAVVELTRNLRSWVVQNSEVVKERVENQIDEAAVRMGFAKTSELDELNARIAELESRLKAGSAKSSKTSAPTKKTSAPRKKNKAPAVKKVSATRKRAAK